MCIQVRIQNCTKSTSRGGDIFQQAQSCLGPFADAIICDSSCKSLAERDLLGWPSKHLSLSKTSSPAYMWTCLAQSSDLGLKKANTDCPGSLILEMSQAPPSDMATRSLPPYLAHIVKVNLHTPPTSNTDKACLLSQQRLGKQMWQQPCACNLSKTSGDFGMPFRQMTQVLSRHTSSLTSDHVHPRYFELFLSYSYKIFTFWLIPTKTNLSRLATQNILKANQSVQMFSTTLTMIHKESSLNVKPTKILSDFGGRDLPAWSTFTNGCKLCIVRSFGSIMYALFRG